MTARRLEQRDAEDSDHYEWLNRYNFSLFALKMYNKVSIIPLPKGTQQPKDGRAKQAKSQIKAGQYDN